MSIDETKEFHMATREVLTDLARKIYEYILLKYKCMKLRDKMTRAQNVEEWTEYARTLDRLCGLEAWKNNPFSRHYDFERIQSKYILMKQLRKTKSINALVHCLRQDLVRNIGEISNPDLYNKCYYGTKLLIEKYHNEVIKCIKFIYYYNGPKLPISQKLEFFAETRHSYGHTALLLSGGATFGKFHFGVIRALYEQDLLPTIISGSSVGALIAASLCCRRYEDIPSLFDPYVIFGTPIFGFRQENEWQMLVRMVQGKTVFCTETLKKYTQKFCGELTFKDSKDKFGWNLNISVTYQQSQHSARLLNYLTSPNVLIWSAVCASCAIPGMFDTVELMHRTEDGRTLPYHPSRTNQRYVDGSVGADLPMQRLAELFNVNNFIVSQVNPHVVMFLAVDRGQVLDTKIRKRFQITIKTLVENQVRHWINQLDCLGFLPAYVKHIANIITQSYKGNVTLVPSPTLFDYRNLLKNVEPEWFQPAFQTQYIHTLRKIALIRSYYGIEREFDRYYSRLKRKTKGYQNGRTDMYLENEKQEDDIFLDCDQELDEHDFEQYSNTHNQLVYYISKHQELTDYVGHEIDQKQMSLVFNCDSNGLYMRSKKLIDKKEVGSLKSKIFNRVFSSGSFESGDPELYGNEEYDSNDNKSTSYFGPGNSQLDTDMLDYEKQIQEINEENLQKETYANQPKFAKNDSFFGLYH